MFTGIIEEMGTIQKIKSGTNSMILQIGAKTVLQYVHIGDSIAVNGICLTVTQFTDTYFTADVMHETLNRSSLRTLKAGSVVNLERAMICGGRFGGHIVSGHIDGTGTIQSIQKDDTAIWYTIQSQKEILRYVVEKGSIAIDGISLTVAKVTEQNFSVSIIPHTAKNTILHTKRVGDIVNLETDIIGKYVEKLFTHESPQKQTTTITKEFLYQNGF